MMKRLCKGDLQKEAVELEKAFWEDALNFVATLGVMYEAYKGLTEQDSGLLNNLIMGALLDRELSQGEIIKLIQHKFPDLSYFSAEKILRTEMTCCMNTARYMGYVQRMKERGQEWKFYWNIVKDNRTSRQCLEIAREVDNAGGSMPIEDLQELIRRVSIKYGGKNWHARPWIAHISCRSVLTRKV